MITSNQLVEFAQKLLDSKAAYWYGTFYLKCTASLYDAKKAQYPNHYTASRAAAYKKDIAADRMCVDCMGLIKGAAWSECGARASKYDTNGCPDKSADAMFSWCKANGMEGGKIGTLPETPGVMLHRSGHAGVYIGKGYAIEARGFRYGVVKTRVSERGWTDWTRLPFVDYAKEPQTLDARYVSVTDGDTVNVRAKPDTDATILGVVNRGDRFEYAGETASNGWHRIRYAGDAAWISGRYTALSEAPEPQPAPARDNPLIVDVSQHDSLKSAKNDWAKIARSVDLLILRCGVTRTNTEPIGIGSDAEFAYAAGKCLEYGIPFGAYYYGKVKTAAEARKEARKAYTTAKAYEPLFYVYDVEETMLTNAAVEAWMDEIRTLSAKKVGLYIANQMYGKFSGAAKAASFVWIPRYGKNTGKYDPQYAPNHPCDLHQYTSVGKVAGFANGTLDLSRLTGTKPLSWFLS